MSNVTLIISLVAYAIFLVAVLYVCFMADPDDSPVALFFTDTLPRKTWNLLSKVLGEKALSVVEIFVDRTLLLVYCAIVFGSWSIIFAHVYPWIDRDDRVSNHHKTMGYIVFAACVVSWRYASTTSPGIITAETMHRYDHFPYDHLMFVPGVMCKSRNIPRLARSKFDRFKYHENVPRFDHFCGWVYNTIGEENYRWFLLFLSVHVGMCAYGSFVVSCLFYSEILEQNLLNVTFFDRFSGEEITASKYIVFQYLFNRHLPEAAVLAIMSVMFIALSLFFLYHAWLTSRGLTTNESYKWDQIQKWHKREVIRYNKAVKDGKIVERKTGSNAPVVTDGDVTCVANVSEKVGDQEEKDNEEDDIIDPGAPPLNIYNRGFVENWREVIFPRSLRSTTEEVSVKKEARNMKPKKT